MKESLQQKPTILIVDDEQVLRIGLSHIIQKAFPEVRIVLVADGREALSALRTIEIVSLAFIDIRMPVIDGLRLCEMIRQEEQNERREQGAKLVILSGFKDFDYARQALRYGVLDYLLKPVNPTEVLRVVRESLENSPTISGRKISTQELIAEQNAEKQARLVVEYVRDWIHRHLDREITLAELADKLHYTPNYLSMLFKRETGKGFQEYLVDCRLQRAALLLKDPSLRMTEIAQQVGYTNAKAFSIAFRKSYGFTPTEYRERQGIKSVDSQTIL